jgi:hypothetical protein
MRRSATTFRDRHIPFRFGRTKTTGVGEREMGEKGLNYSGERNGS